MSDRWQTILAIDSDKWASRTYAANLPDTRVECGPVADYIDALPDADCVLSGFPCQPHSLSGKRLASADERDGGDDFVAAVRKVRPRHFLGENVPGLVSSENGRYWQRLYAALEDAGYVVQYRIQDAVNFGVPQFRSRLWVWGIRRDLYAAGMRHAFPVATHEWPPPQPGMFGGELLAGVTVGQALGLSGHVQRGERGAGIIERHGDRDGSPTCEPSPMVGNGENGSNRLYIQSHADPAQPIDRPAPTLRSGGDGHDGCCLRLEYDHGVAVSSEPCPTLKAGGNFDAGGRQGGGCPPLVAYRWSDAMLLKHPPASPASPAPTVMAKWLKGGAEGLLAAGPWKHKGDLWIRRLSPLECARLQSVPDSFVWPEGITKTNVYRIVGNGWSCAHSAHFSRAIAAVDPEASTVIDLFCGGGLGAVGWHQNFWSYEPSEVPS